MLRLWWLLGPVPGICQTQGLLCVLKNLAKTVFSRSQRVKKTNVDTSNKKQRHYTQQLKYLETE
jgi:hypothetical protein